MARSIVDLLPTTKLGWGASGRPNNFELGPDSTLHNTSSVNNNPPLSSYASAFIRRQKPTVLSAKITTKYLDNPPI